jgi:AcrR family transcriptional regulator
MAKAAIGKDKPRRISRGFKSVKRLEKKAATRDRLLQTAAKIIGRYGYKGCSISRVTLRAGVAHGAFYLYFKSQQALFDELLPAVGGEMLNYISEAIRDSKGLLDLERRGLTANFEYLSKQPHMYRVLHEAELYSATAYQKHLSSMVDRYRRSLHRSLLADQLHDFSDNDLDVLATMFIGARDHLLTRYCMDGQRIRPLPPHVIDAYIKFVEHGLKP